MRKGSHTAGSILPIETLHVDGGIERLTLHRALKYGAVPSITLNPARPLGYSPTSPTIETGDIMTLLEQ